MLKRFEKRYKMEDCTMQGELKRLADEGNIAGTVLVAPLKGMRDGKLCNQSY